MNATTTVFVVIDVDSETNFGVRVFLHQQDAEAEIKRLSDQEQNAIAAGTYYVDMQEVPLE